MDLSAVRQSGIFQDSPLTSEPSTEESRNKRPDGEKTDHTKLSSYERKEEKKKAKKKEKKRTEVTCQRQHRQLRHFCNKLGILKNRYYI